MNRATTAIRAATALRRRKRTPMANSARIFAVTGDAVARFRLGDPKPEFTLEGYHGRCIAIDPRDPERVYVGTLDNGLRFSTDGGANWREAAHQSMSPECYRSPSLGQTSAPACRSPRLSSPRVDPTPGGLSRK